jgi:branched-chain amino acid transport system ATP-binding protein
VTTKAIEVDGLMAGYGAVDVLREITFAVDNGSMVGIVGPNGAGKTTLLRTLSGLIKPRRGTISLHGVSCVGKSVESIAILGVAHVPEGRRVFTGMSVIDNLRVGAFGRHLSRSALQARLDQVFGIFPQLAARTQQRAGTLSGGEAQMLSIGRALIGQPSLLLLDEPTQGLSPAAVKTLTTAIRDVHALGVTIILVEQNLGMARQLVNTALVLSKGRIAHTVSADELADRELFRRLIGDASTEEPLGMKVEPEAINQHGGQIGR